MGRIKKEEALRDDASSLQSADSSSTSSPELKAVSLPLKACPTVVEDSCLTTEPCFGISSFHHFRLPKSFHVPSGSIFIGIQTKSNEQCSTQDNSIEVESNCTEDLSSSPIYPNILRHNRNDLKKSKLLGSPMKTLTFSPSKFLNTSANENCDKLSLDFSKDISMSSNLSDVEDSGIVVSDSSLVEDIGLMPLTSTPSSRSRRKSPQQFIEMLSENDKHSCKASRHLEIEKPFIETPQIKKFLNTSVPKTPTPIKFPSSSEVSLKQEKGLLKGVESIRHSSNYFNELHNVMDTTSLINKADLKAKTTGQGCRFRRNLFDEDSRDKNEPRKLLKIECRNSINGKKVILKKHKTAPYGKIASSKTVVRRERAASLSDKWVSVACGRSYDQRIMTAAAKKCMEEE